MRFRSIALICAAAIAAVLATQGLRLIPEHSPVERGAAAANAYGCIDCHGTGKAGFPNDSELSCSDKNTDRSHPRYDGRCGDVLAYFEVIRLKRTFKTRMATSSRNRLLEGEALARKYNCFQCHGELGQGGFQNPGSLKGYIPGYFGNDFSLLTQDGSIDSVSSWINHGIDPALYARPIEGMIARFYMERQAVSMPVFDSLPDATIQLLAEYVIALNRFGPMDAKTLREYSEATEHAKTAGPGELPNIGASIVE